MHFSKFIAKTHFSLLLLVLSTINVYAADINRLYALGNVYGRDAIQLNGEWRYLIDPQKNALDHWKNSNRIYEDRLFEDSFDRGLFEYDFSNAPKFTMPGDWNSRVRELEWYDSTVWFRRHEQLQLEQGTRYILYFEAANYRSYVYVNGQEVGRHEGGFTPFAFEVTEKLHDGTNSIVVGVDSRYDRESIPSPNTDWKNYGGLTRPVHLVKVPETYIHDYQLQLSADGTQLIGRVQMQGTKRNDTEVRIHLPELQLTLSAKPNKNGNVSFSVPRPTSMQLWHPDAPKLYDVNIASGNDQIQDRIGFRIIETQGHKIILNGKPIFLRGICLHEETLGENPSRALDWDSARALLKIAKQDLNANFVRLAHYPHSEKMTRLADEMGLLVWSEVPVYWTIAFDSTKTLENAKQQISENVLRDINRASIIIWSIANETPDSAERIQFLSTLIDKTRALDPTRLVSAAMNHFESDGNITRPSDKLADKLDLVAVNTYEGWYGKRTLDEVKQLRWQWDYDKPLVFSEFGAGAKKGFYDKKAETKFSEDYQAAYYQATLSMIDQNDLAGTMPWILKDFKSPRRYHSIYQEYWNRKGLISPKGKKKKAFNILKAWYDEKAKAALRD